MLKHVVVLGELRVRGIQVKASASSHTFASKVARRRDAAGMLTGTEVPVSLLTIDARAARARVWKDQSDPLRRRVPEEPSLLRADLGAVNTDSE